MTPRPALALAALLAATAVTEAQMVRRSAPTGTSRIGAHYLWQGDNEGQSVSASLDLVPNFLLRAYHTRVEFAGGATGAASAAGLALTETRESGRYSLTYYKGWHDDGLVRRDRDSAELAWSLDLSPSWEIELAVTRYDNPDDLAPALTAPSVTARYNSGGAFSLDLGWSSKDTLGGTDREDPTWTAGFSFRF